MRTLSSFIEEVAAAVEEAYNRGAAVSDWGDLEDAQEVIAVLEQYMNDDEFEEDEDTMETVVQQQIQILKDSKS